ncbi:MAG: hypothetical protein R3B07_31895 [Polyangiaceae bacterium]
MGWMSRLFGRTDPVDVELAHTSELLDQLLLKVRDGQQLDEEELERAGAAFAAYWEALSEDRDVEENTDLWPEDRARFYSEAIKLTALGHPSHSAWHYMSTIRELVLRPLRRRASRHHEPWIYLAAIQPALVRGELNQARLFYARIADDPFLAGLARQWAFDASMNSAYVEERALCESFLENLE